MLKRLFLRTLPITKQFTNCDGEKIVKKIQLLPDGNIEKITNHMTRLEFDILSFFSERYNLIFEKDAFRPVKMMNNSPTIFWIKFIHPYLTIGLKQFFVSKKTLIKETDRILRDYINSDDTIIGKIRKNNSNIQKIILSVGEDKWKRTNYFTYKGKIYLMDIENFYVQFFDKCGNLISNTEIKTDYKLCEYHGGIKENKLEYAYTL